MKKKLSLLSLLTIMLALNLCGCKQDAVKPPESQEVKDLKQYYANTAKVDINSIKYDESQDEFSINGNGKITRTKLLKFYGFSKQPVKMILPNSSVTINKK